MSWYWKLKKSMVWKSANAGFNLQHLSENLKSKLGALNPKIPEMETCETEKQHVSAPGTRHVSYQSYIVYLELKWNIGGTTAVFITKPMRKSNPRAWVCFELEYVILSFLFGSYYFLLVALAYSHIFPTFPGKLECQLSQRKNHCLGWFFPQYVPKSISTLVLSHSLQQFTCAWDTSLGPGNDCIIAALKIVA